MQLRTGVGVLKLEVLYGQDPGDRHWGCPIRERWGLSDHQQMSLGLEDKLAFTVTASASYEEAAAVAGKWGVDVDGSTLHALAQPLAVLMLDGWQVRQRGPGWGKQKTKQPRVEWHEWKTGVFYRHEQSGTTASGRGVLAEKVVIGWQGDPVEFGRRLHWEALRGGLGRARHILVAGDGAPWIWNVAADRWAGAIQVLDFYHASQHLWELGRALHGDDEAAAARWVEPRRHQLRHGKEKRVLGEMDRLEVPTGDAGEIIRREQNYFANQAGRMNYQLWARRGWPIASGPVESACRQKQCRFKRPGQFWTPTGMRNLGALTEARHNGHWDELWLIA